MLFVVRTQLITAGTKTSLSEHQDHRCGSVQQSTAYANPTYHEKSQCVGYVVEFDGIKLYHAGDTRDISEMGDLANQNITYALFAYG